MIDKEVEIMSKIAGLICDLDEAEVGRVLRWACEKYIKKAVSFSAIPRTFESSVVSEGQYPDFSSFYAAANPKTESEKALVSSYWQQIYQGNKDLDSQLLNKALKQLGHGVTNITRSLDVLIKSRPQLVLQTKKEGNSKQGRKKYRVTEHGKKIVNEMIAKNTGSSEG